MRKFLIGLVIALCVAIPAGVFAATSDTPVTGPIRGLCGIDVSKLTDQQKAKLLDSFKQMMESKKEIINEMVQNGTITKEQGNAATKRIDNMIEYREENG